MATTKAGSSGDHPPQELPPLTLGSPRILDLRGARRGGKRRKRYSKGTKDVQRLAYGASKGAYRIANGFAAGLDSFWKRSNRSSRKKRDGFVRDAFRNLARGARKASRQFGRAPQEISDRFRTRRFWRQTRRALRNVPLPFLLR